MSSIINKILLTKGILIFLIFTVTMATAQQDSSFNKQGNIYGDVFLNANYNISKKYASVRLNRLHLGYKYYFTKQLYFNGMIESALEGYEPVAIGNDYDGITNLFEFCLGFSSEKIDAKFGLIGTEFNQQQEKLWGHRYVDKVFADKYGFAPTNDFGAMVIYKPAELLKVDVAVTNGEGHKSLQADSSFRIATGITTHFLDGFVARVYVDFENLSDNLQTNLIGILGYNSQPITLGIEWNQQINSYGFSGYNRNGFSGYITGNINEKFQLFGRFDIVSSNTPKGLGNDWNVTNDGTLTITGIQYKLIKNVTLAVDYRNWNPADANVDLQSFVFMETAIIF